MASIEHYKQNLSQWVQQHQAKTIWQYQVPLLGEGGTCSLFGELDDTPFDLTSTLNAQQQQLVPLAQAVSDWVKENTNVDWFGIYLSRDDGQQQVLTKLAYFGAPSRAEFPITAEFAQISNNSNVGLTGQRRTINNVQEYVASGGEYYTCDPKVKSELCWPILLPENSDKNIAQTDTENEILGIIDAESFTTDSFDQSTQDKFEAVVQVLSELLTTPTQG